MNKIKAFIGHSFSEDDQEVVRIFLEYFDSLKSAMPFDWDHAKKAEAKALSDKVIEKMKDKNLFIGIFTKKHRQIVNINPKLSLFKKNIVCTEKDLGWGISNWIVQESGYALGKGMRLLFIIEDEITRFPGLHADHEFVQFNREKPQLCFPKINEMIGSIVETTTKTISDQKTIAPKPIDSDKDREPQIQKSNENNKNKSTLEALKSLNEIIVKDRDFDKAKEEINRIIQNQSNDIDKIYLRAICCSWRSQAGDESAVNELIGLIDERPGDAKLLKMVGDTYFAYKTYSKAVYYYTEAYNLEQRIEIKIDYLNCLINTLMHMNDFTKAYKLVLEMFNKNNLSENQIGIIYRILSDIAKKEPDNDLFEAFTEKALEVLPVDNDLRFSLAYHYSELEKESYALYHYKILCEHNENGTNLNNMAVAYDSLGIKGKSIHSYQLASSKYKETLSMANMAYRFISEGFYENAGKVLDIARMIEGYHENINSASSSLSHHISDEDKKEELHLNSTFKRRLFFQKLADAYAIPSDIQIDGEWTFYNKIFRIEVIDGVLCGSHFSREKAVSLSLLYHQAIGLGRIPAPEEYVEINYDLKGTINNRAVFYEMDVNRKYEAGSPDKREKFNGIMIVNDENTIEVLERKPEDKEEELLLMKRYLGKIE